MFEKAKWIWTDGATMQDAHISFFESAVKSSATQIYLSCDGDFALYINGKLAGFGQYGDYPWYKSVEIIDITSFLTDEINEIRIDVWYYGESTFNYYKSSAGLIYEIISEGKTIAFSSKNTNCAESAGFVQGREKNITWLLGYGYCYDTRLPQGKRRAASEIVKICTFVSRPVERLYIADSIRGKVIGNGGIYDLGKETVGFLRLNFSTENGKILKIRYGEHLTDGSVRWRVSQCGELYNDRDYKYELEFIGSGKNENLLIPFRILACRYIQVECDGKYRIDYIGIEEVLYPVEERSVTLAVPIRNSIYKTACRTLRLCMHQHFEDCPLREQALYAGDGMLEMRYAYAAFTETNYQKASLALLAEGQREDGLLPICAPSSVNKTIPSFSLLYIKALKEYYDASGDTSLLIKYFPRAKRLVDLFLSRKKNSIVPRFYGKEEYWNFYEWTDGLVDGTQESDSALNLLLAIVLGDFGDLCETIGKNADAENYRNEKNEIDREVKRRFYCKETGVFKTYDDGGFHKLVNAWGVLSDSLTKQENENLCEKLIEKNGLEDCTLSMTAFLYDALIKTDKKRYTTFILNDIDQKFSYMLACGATSFWETLLGEKDMGGSGSLCHGWSALPVYYYRLLDDSAKEKK